MVIIRRLIFTLFLTLRKYTKKAIILGGIWAIILLTLGILFTEESIQIVAKLSMKGWIFLTIFVLISEYSEYISIISLSKVLFGDKEVVPEDFTRKVVLKFKAFSFLIFITLCSAIILIF